MKVNPEVAGMLAGGAVLKEAKEGDPAAGDPPGSTPSELGIQICQGPRQEKMRDLHLLALAPHEWVSLLGSGTFGCL